MAVVFDHESRKLTSDLATRIVRRLTIAELMGHRDGAMLAKVYAHLDRKAHLKKALED